MKRGEFAVAPAPAGTQPDLSGLSCRFEEIPSARGLILSVLVVPAKGADPLRFRKVIEDVIASGRAQPRCRTAGAAGRAAVALAAAGRRV